MLVTVKELLKQADMHNKAIGCFNITGLENIQAVLSAAVELKEPVIIQFAQVHEENNIIDLDTIGPIMVEMAKKAPVPVAVHLDHGVDLSYLEKALKIGFTSIMFDGSSLQFEENIAKTITAVKMAKKYGASVEAEVGVMAGETLNENKVTENRILTHNMYTDPSSAKKFVELTGVDCLACAFGTVHGLYTSAPMLDFDLVKELHKNIGVPIVMHGGSGISPEDYDKVIEAGVRKVNYYTYMAKFGGEAIRSQIPAEGAVYFHDLANIAIAAMKENVKFAIQVFKHNNKEN
jgi:fructose-bisphosphate aldolase class II